MIWIVLLLVCLLVFGVVLTKRENGTCQFAGIMLCMWSLIMLAKLIGCECA